MKTKLIWILAALIVLLGSFGIFILIQLQFNKYSPKPELVLGQATKDILQNRRKPSTLQQQHVVKNFPPTKNEENVEDTGSVPTEDTAASPDKDVNTRPENAVDAVTETAIIETEENIRKSLFGFGTYPEVPLGLFPHGEEVWDEIESLYEDDSRLARNVELMVRLRIKLWELGTETVGASMENGLIYPSIPNLAYVTYGTRETEDGKTKQYIQSITGGGGLTAEEYEMVEAGVTPLGWTILSHASGGIDPYMFLELE